MRRRRGGQRNKDSYNLRAFSRPRDSNKFSFQVISNTVSRDPGAPAFNELKKELTSLVMEKQRRHERDETRASAT